MKTVICEIYGSRPFEGRLPYLSDVLGELPESFF
jgi:hypothetical protein